MSQSVIPNQFESYLTERSEAGLAPNMNEFVFAYLPNLDLDTPVDVNSGLPSESQIVHRQDVDQSARINSNTLVYTVILASDLPSFTFNAIYLHDKNTPNSVGFIVHKEDEVKESGLTITKSIAQSYEGAEDIADIHVAPQTWQIDYQARLAGIDDDVRLLSIDHYYHHAFVSGFDVTKVSDSQVEVAEGVAYVGGLRCELMESVTVNASSGTIYLDVSRDGSVLSRHVNHVNVRVSATTLSDYQDTNGRFHYLAPIARFSSGHWEDLRVQEVVSQTEAEAGTATTARKWTAQRVRQAIDAHPVVSDTKNYVEDKIGSKRIRSIYGGYSGQPTISTDEFIELLESKGAFDLSEFSINFNRSAANGFILDVGISLIPSSGMYVNVISIDRDNFQIRVMSAYGTGMEGSKHAEYIYQHNASYGAGWRRVYADDYHPNADQLTQPRTLTTTLKGAVTGSASMSFDGSANKTVEINAVVANDSHTHDSRYYTKTQSDAKYPLLTDARLSNSREWTAAVVTQEEAETGTATTARKWTAQRVRQAIDAHPIVSDTKNYVEDKIGSKRIRSISGGYSGQPTISTDEFIELLESKGAFDLSEFSINFNRSAANGFILDVGISLIPSSGMYVNVISIDRDNFQIRVMSAYGTGMEGSKHAEYIYQHNASYGAGWRRVYADDYHPNADQLTQPRTLTTTLKGAVTGSASMSFDGSANKTVEINAVVANDSHTHDSRYYTKTQSDAKYPLLTDARLSNSREWTAAVVSQTEAEAGTATTARKWTAQRISQAIKKQRKVVGETYVQFPGRAAPASLFGGTWSALFESEGVFFRTPGGDATAFGGGIQGDAIRNITGSFNTNSSYFSSASYAHATGPFTASEASGSPLRRNSGGEGSDVMNIKFDASKIVPTSTENRPKNRTIRVWYKTE